MASAGRMRTWFWRRRRRGKTGAAIAEAERRVCRYRCWCPAETRRRCVRRLIATPAGCRRHAEVDWSDVVSTAALHRTHFAARASVSARDAAEAVEALRALGEGRSHAAVSVGEARDRGRVVFVFPGQGSQWTSMGRTLLAESSVFAETIAACEAALGRYTDWSLTAVLRGDESIGASLLERVDVIQPSLFAMNVGLAAVWRSLGLEPSAVVGHSQGEIAAAVVAGILSLEEGARVVALRSQLLRRVSGRGAMAVTELAARGGGRAAAGSGVVGAVAGGGEHAGLDGCLGLERSG